MIYVKNIIVSIFNIIGLYERMESLPVFWTGLNWINYMACGAIVKQQCYNGFWFTIPTAVYQTWLFPVTCIISLLNWNCYKRWTTCVTIFWKFHQNNSMLHLFHHLLQSLFGTSLYYTPINIGMYQYALLIPVSGGIFLFDHIKIRYRERERENVFLFERKWKSHCNA